MTNLTEIGQNYGSYARHDSTATPETMHMVYAAEVSELRRKLPIRMQRMLRK